MTKIPTTELIITSENDKLFMEEFAEFLEGFAFWLAGIGEIDLSEIYGEIADDYKIKNRHN